MQHLHSDSVVVVSQRGELNDRFALSKWNVLRQNSTWEDTSRSLMVLRLTFSTQLNVLEG